MANCEKPAIDSLGKFGDLANLAKTDEKENPGALAGASGVDQLSISFRTEEYRKRAEAATALCHAIADCEPEDAAPILEAALLSFGAGSPVPPLMTLMGEANTWAEFATGAELKAYCLAAYTKMTPAHRAGFLAYIGEGR